MEITSHEKEVEHLKAFLEPYDIRKDLSKWRADYPEDLIREASVLVPLLFRNGECYIVLTQRSENLTHHAGYVAFPGGLRDSTDKDVVHTALREAEEEIGLKASDVEIICVFPPGLVRPNYLTYPVFAVLTSEFQPKVNKSEVSVLFELPLKRFLSKDRTRTENIQFPNKIAIHTHHFLDTVDGKEVDTWGFTAVYCIIAALAVYQTEDTFEFVNNFTINRHHLYDTRTKKLILTVFLKHLAKL